MCESSRCCRPPIVITVYTELQCRLLKNAPHPVTFDKEPQLHIRNEPQLYLQF